MQAILSRLAANTIGSPAANTIGLHPIHYRLAPHNIQFYLTHDRFYSEHDTNVHRVAKYKSRIRN